MASPPRISSILSQIKMSPHHTHQKKVDHSIPLAMGVLRTQQIRFLLLAVDLHRIPRRKARVNHPRISRNIPRRRVRHNTSTHLIICSRAGALTYLEKASLYHQEVPRLKMMINPEAQSCCSSASLGTSRRKRLICNESKTMPINTCRRGGDHQEIQRMRLSCAIGLQHT